MPSTCLFIHPLQLLLWGQGSASGQFPFHSSHAVNVGIGWKGGFEYILQPSPLPPAFYCDFIWKQSGPVMPSLIITLHNWHYSVRMFWMDVQLGSPLWSQNTALKLGLPPQHWKNCKTWIILISPSRLDPPSSQQILLAVTGVSDTVFCL